MMAATLDLGLRRLPVPERRVVLSVDEPLYLSVHTPAARLVRAGASGEVVHVLCYGAMEDRDATAAMAAFLDRCQPGWRDEVVVERHRRRMVVAHDRPRPGAGPGAGLAGRMPVAVPDCPGVFVAGDWVGPAGLLADASVASGRAAALAALGGAR